MTKKELFDFLKENLFIQVRDHSTPTTCGGEVEGCYGVEVILLLRDPETGEKVIIDRDDCDLY